MPGIDKSRVVGKDEEELNEFTCSICQDIFEEPVVTKCCRQSFCTLCIHQWLEDNNTCPNDRKRLTVRQLLPAPRIVTNLLNKLSIKCENYGNGCESILKYEEMANHMKTCNTCDSCKTSQKLLSEKQKEIEKLKKELAKSNEKFEKLKFSNPISAKSEANAITNARRSSTPIEHKLKEITDEELEYLTKVAKSALLKRRSFRDVSEFIYRDIVKKNEFKSYKWVIKTDFINRKTIICYKECKGVNLAFDYVNISFTAYKSN